MRFIMMTKIPLIRRKSLLTAEISNSQLIVLTQRVNYFQNRPAGNSFFSPFDALLVFIAVELFEYLPFRNVSKAIDSIVKNHRNLYGLLRQDPDQFLIVEKTTDYDAGLPMSKYVTYPLTVASMKVMEWEKKESMILVNLAKIYKQIENLFNDEGLNVPTD